MSDSWCRPIRGPSGKRISGGAAREHRIKALGGDNGLDGIIEDTVRQAVRDAFERANEAVTAPRIRRLRVVK